MFGRTTLGLFGLGASLVGCGGKTDGLGVNQAALRSMSDCPNQIHEDGAITKVCVADDEGNFYSPIVSPHPAAPDGMLVVPSGRKLAIVYVFADGYVPRADDVGASDAVRTYAAPYDVSPPTPAGSAPAGGPIAAASPCCAEDREGNRIDFHAALEGNTMTVSLDEIPGDGEQVAALLGYAELYAHRIAPTCDLPGVICTYAANMGFSVRFYVGHRP